MFTMRSLILCCLVALATSQSLRYDVVFNPKKTYEYKYEGLVNFGLGMPNLAESGAKLTCKIRISGASEQQFFLQVSDLKFEEFTGFPEKTTYEASMKLTQRIAAQLTKPIMFDYVSGHVVDIHASDEVSETIVNIVRGILDFFDVTLKTKHKIYELEEVGIHGMCHSQYVTEENPQTEELTVTQVVDLNNCRDKAALVKGMALALPDKLTRQEGESVVTTLKYVYRVKPSAEGGVITTAQGVERQYFSPFNVKGGSFKMLAAKELTLLSVTDTVRAVAYGPMKSRGNLVYKFVNVEANVPIMMQDLHDPIPKAMKLIKSLAKDNEYQVDSATTEDTMRLYQLLRAIPYEGLETMWKNLSADAEHRRWFLDTITEVNDIRILKFLEARFLAADVTTNEALQTIMIAFDHLQAQPDLVEYAKRFLSMPFSKTSVYLWQTVMLSYGTLVYKHCAYSTTPCPLTDVQPLLNMATESLRRHNDTDMVLALKALGNAGHPASIKTIMRFLPAVAATPVDVPPRVQSAAVQSMRLIAARDPHSVQDITLKLFLERNLSSEIRMMAFVILLETKPSIGLVSTITIYLQKEEDLHVASFAYTYLQNLARSRTPDNHYLSIASSVAVKILAPKLGRLSYGYSRAGRLDWFCEDFLIGTAPEVVMLRSVNSLFPTQMTTKSNLYAIGRIMELMEVGFYADGLKDLLTIPEFKGDFSLRDVFAIVNAFKKWENMPSDKPVITAFSRLSGQEWFFADMSKEFIRSIVMAINSTAAKESPLWRAIEIFQKGFKFHWTKPFLTFEARYLEATLLGLPLEISKFYHAVTSITVNAKGAITPLTGQLGQVLNSQISLDSDGFIGFTKDFWLFYGINTELFQCGSEFKTKIPVSAPWNFAANINVPERKLAIDLPTYEKEIHIISVTSNVYAVFRNSEELSTPKMIPIMSDLPEEMQTSSVWEPKARMCTNGSIYGVDLCLDYELRRQYYQEEYPLYYFLGYTHMTFGVAPAQATKPLDRIRLEINAWPTKQPMNVLQLLQNLRKLSSVATERVSLSSESSSAEETTLSELDFLMASNSTPEALVNFRALAMTGSQETGGYEASVYYVPEASRPSAQLIVTKVGEDWKMCVDTSMDNITAAKAHVRWGADCQSYEMSMAVGAVLQPDVKPTLKAKVHWTKIPDSMTEMGERLESYIPGMAFLSGFYRQEERNPRQEVSASLVAASEDSVDVKIRLPKYTVYRQAIPLPMTPARYQELHQNIRNATLI